MDKIYHCVFVCLLAVSFNIAWDIDLWGRMRAAKSASWSDFQAVLIAVPK